jgi:hypothetical protein
MSGAAFFLVGFSDDTYLLVVLYSIVIVSLQLSAYVCLGMVWNIGNENT